MGATSRNWLRAAKMGGWAGGWVDGFLPIKLQYFILFTYKTTIFLSFPVILGWVGGWAGGWVVILVMDNTTSSGHTLRFLDGPCEYDFLKFCRTLTFYG